MAFHDVRFPPTIEQGAVGGPTFLTTVQTMTGGQEQRNAAWSRPRYRWDIATGLKTEEDYQEALGFFMARYGRLHSFRFRDWSDYIAPALSPVVAVPGTASYRLAKAYTFGGYTFTRPITKPVSGSVTLSAGTVDYATGIVSGGSGVTWEGQFDVCVRFDRDEFELTLEQVDIGQARGVIVVEVYE